MGRELLATSEVNVNYTSIVIYNCLLITRYSCFINNIAKYFFESLID